MYEYRELQDMFFMMLYGGVALFAVMTCLYLLLKRSNAFLVWRVETLQELKEN